MLASTRAAPSSVSRRSIGTKLSKWGFGACSHLKAFPGLPMMSMAWASTCSNMSGRALFATTLGAALLGQSDPVALSLADQGALKLCKRTHHRQQQFAIGESSPLKPKLSLTNSIRIPRLVNVCTSRRRSSRLRARRSILYTTTVSPSRANAYRASSCARCVSFARGLVGGQLVHLGLIELTLWIPVETADPDITDALTSQNVPP
jgi:hypothetical protein